MKRILIGGIALGLSVALSGCGGSGATHGGIQQRTSVRGLEGARYVALGDSYTAAPGIAGGKASSDYPACAQSARSYPFLVAEKLGLSLDDVACSGAKTDQMWNEQDLQNEVVPPQFDALDAFTRVVTVSIGGNDHYAFAQLIGPCVVAAQNDPTGSPCADYVAGKSGGIDKAIAQFTGKLTTRLDKVVAGIVSRAPSAKVLVVGYPQIVPARGTCSQLPIATGDYPYARRIIEAFNAALRSAAAKEKATYVDVYGVTAGHDICGSTPWIAGLHPTQPGAAYHPYAAEQQAVADQVVKALGK